MRSGCAVFAFINRAHTVAIGNDIQWKRLVSAPEFRSLAREERSTNASRLKDARAIHREMAVVAARRRTSELMARFEEAGIPHAPIHTIAEVREMQAVARKLTTTRTPDGRTIRLPPPAVDLATTPSEYAFAPRYGEHTAPVLEEAGFSKGEIAQLRTQGVVST